MTIPTTMRGVHLTGNGGLDKLEYRQNIPVPIPQDDEVLIQVGACGMNNTDINTRTAWYSKSVTSATAQGGEDGFDQAQRDDSTWGGPGLTFPRIQGADITGRIVAAGKSVSDRRVGERVLVDPWMRNPTEPENRALVGYLGSERDGGYAEYATVPSVNAFKIETSMNDSELATFPCSYSTGEYMLTRARLAEHESVLITGASGGVGSALVQLAKLRGAHVIAIASHNKMHAVRDLGADSVVDRGGNNIECAVRDAAPDGCVHVVADIVGGKNFPLLLEILQRGGRYVTSGAIAGPMVELDLRTLYLKDLELWGATVMPQSIFPHLVSLIEQAKLKALVAKTFPLQQMQTAQKEFLEKKHVGNFVIMP